MSFIKKHQKWILIVVSILVLIFLIRGFANIREQKEKEAKADKTTKELLEEAKKGDINTSDSLLMQMQSDLMKTYGKVPKGFIWDIDGKILSLGDPSMTAEEVVYAYLNGLSSLDMSSVQRYSRDSVVVGTYDGYFDEQNKNTDYTDQLLRRMYTECLKSFQVKGIDNVSVFAENKQVFTVSVNMLDLTKKDFWMKDKDIIYKNLSLFDSDESDSTKANIYLYDYIMEYYSSDLAESRNVTFDLTVQRYPDLESGWLVSVDTDVDNACRYRDGKLVVSYINEMFQNEGIKYLKSLESAEEE